MIGKNPEFLPKKNLLPSKTLFLLDTIVFKFTQFVKLSANLRTTLETEYLMTVTTKKMTRLAGLLGLLSFSAMLPALAGPLQISNENEPVVVKVIRIAPIESLDKVVRVKETTTTTTSTPSPVIEKTTITTTSTPSPVVEQTTVTTVSTQAPTPAPVTSVVVVTSAPAPFVSPAPVAPSFFIRSTDSTVRDVLTRWSQSAGWTHLPLHWTIDKDHPVEGGIGADIFGNDFKAAVRTLLSSTEMTDRPVQPCFYTNKVVRVIPNASMCDKSAF